MVEPIISKELLALHVMSEGDTRKDRPECIRREVWMHADGWRRKEWLESAEKWTALGCWHTSGLPEAFQLSTASTSLVQGSEQG